MIALLAAAAVTLAVWTIGEVVVLHGLPRWARYTGFSLASLGGDLADRYSEIPTELAGLEVSRLDDTEHSGDYLIEDLTDRLKVDEGALEDLSGPVLRFKEIPSAPELATLLDGFVNDGDRGRLLP